MLTNEQRRRLTRALSVPDQEEERELPPLDSALEERLIANAQALLAGGGEAGAKKDEQAERPPGVLAQVIDLNTRREAANAPKQARTAARRSWTRMLAPVWRVAAAGAVVAAASLGFWWWGPAGPPLSPYALEVRSEVQHLGPLGGPSTVERSRLSTDSRLRLTLRPNEAVAGPLAVTAYRRQVGLELQRWPEGQPAEQESGGVKHGLLTLDRSVEELHLTPGRWQLIYVVGRPRRLPSDEEVKSLVLTGERPTGDSQWQLRSLYVDIVTRP